MKKLLLNRIRQGEFDPSPSIQKTIDSLNKSYFRAKETVEKMHKGDELTWEESMTREFRYYSNEMQKTKLKQFEDEQKKMFSLRKEFQDIFETDVWDEVILNYEFYSIEDFYKSVKLYLKEKS
jgi:hypothetical protein